MVFCVCRPAVFFLVLATSHAEHAACTPEPKTEYLGDDVAPPLTGVADEGACCSACAANGHCHFFTFCGGVCSLKNNDAPDYSRPNSSCTSGFPGTVPPSPPAPANATVVVGGGPALSTTGPNFVCWNIDASANRGFFWRNLSAADPGSYGAQLARQAAAIGSAQEAGYSLLRFGGSGNDYLTYEGFGATRCTRPPSDYNQCLNVTQWRDLLSFTANANARMIFGLSMNTGRDRRRRRPRRRLQASTTDAPTGGTPGRARAAGGPFPYPWDPTNAREILAWTIDQKLDHLIYGFELGNEQNTQYTGTKMAAGGTAVLYNLTVELWPDPATRPKLFGPDPHSFHDADGDIAAWIVEWLDECRRLGVPIHAVTHHEYVEVDAGTFTSPAKLDMNGAIAAKVNASVRAHDAGVLIFGGEIGPHNGGSPPCDHTSMRWANFGDSLWYADALGSKALNGYAGLCRQDYIGADYGLLDCSTGTPLPDYYTALAWAKTMGRGVLGATASSRALRAYAHCGPAASAATSSSSSGSVTVVVINLSNGTVPVEFSMPPPTSRRTSKTAVTAAATSSKVRQWLLTPSEDPKSSLIHATGILGTGVELNGKLLQLGKGGEVPAMAGMDVDADAVKLPPTSVGFFLFPGAHHPACHHP